GSRGRAGPDHHRHPRADGPPALGEVALDRRHRPRDGLDPGRARGHHRGLALGGAEVGGDRPGPHQHRHRDGRCGVRRRCVHRRPLLRAADRPLRTEEAVPPDARGLPVRHRADRLLDEPALLLRLPLHHRRRHRRGVRRDQLRDRRADPREVPRPHRHRHQRLLLGRRRLRRHADRAAARPRRRGQPGARLARCLRARGGAGDRHPDRASQRAGEPPLALHPRSRGRGGEDRPRHRGDRGAGDRQVAADRLGDAHDPPAQDDPAHDDRQDRLHPLPQAHGALPGALHRPGLPLQRLLLHLRRQPLDVPRRRADRLVHRRLRGQQLRRRPPAGVAVRHRRPGQDDRGHLHHLRRAARGRRLPAGQPQRGRADDLRHGHLLLRLRRGQRGVPHGQRGLPDGDPRPVHRVLLRHRHRRRRHQRAPVLRWSHRPCHRVRGHRRHRPGVLRRGRAHDRRRHRRDLPRGARGAADAGEHREAPHGGGRRHTRVWLRPLHPRPGL
ncbi:MAG: Uncharacterized MFS-type transporter Saci_1521, partial [uncultured Nocardioides sp.]